MAGPMKCSAVSSPAMKANRQRMANRTAQPVVARRDAGKVASLTAAFGVIGGQATAFWSLGRGKLTKMTYPNKSRLTCYILVHGARRIRPPSPLRARGRPTESHQRALGRT